MGAMSKGESMAADVGIYVILDGSGSMSGVKNDVVTGINDFIAEQQKDSAANNDRTEFTLVAFDDNVREVYDHEDISLVNPVTVSQTYLGGGTALLDAVGRTLTKAEEDQAVRNLVVIYTDGEENQSHEFTHKEVKDLYEKFSQSGNWQFIFLGAEFAEFAEAGAFVGVAAASTYNTSKANVGQTWSTLSQGANYYRNATADTITRMSDPNKGLLSTAVEDGALSINDMETAVDKTDEAKRAKTK
jgi:uncharacterized protein YegL